MANDYDDNPGQGVLFTNTHKKSPNQPDYTGHGKTPSGETVRLAGWKKTSKSGTPYMSLAISDPMDQRRADEGDERDEPDPWV